MNTHDADDMVHLSIYFPSIPFLGWSVLCLLQIARTHGLQASGEVQQATASVRPFLLHDFIQHPRIKNVLVWSPSKIFWENPNPISQWMSQIPESIKRSQCSNLVQFLGHNKRSYEFYVGREEIFWHLTGNACFCIQVHYGHSTDCNTHLCVLYIWESESVHVQ